LIEKKAERAVGALKAFESLISAGLIKAISQDAEKQERRQIFSSAVVVWMMIHQRLHPVKSLSAAVTTLQMGGPTAILKEQGSLPARTRKISDNTGGYARARERLPIATVEQIADDVSEALSEIRLKKPEAGPAIYAVDGTTIRLAHSTKNIRAYPQYKNQHGKAHYPLMHVAVATNIETGVALRPEVGAFNGEEAISEVVLSERLLARLPEKSVVLGDRLYGTCRFAAEVRNAGHSPIVRMRDDIAKKFIGSTPGSAGEITVDWSSDRSRSGRSYQVSGRVVWHTVRRKGFRPQFFILFTTLTDISREKVVEIYLRRWNVELDLRDLKATLEMEMLYSKNPCIAEKEIVIGLVAYNLVRHFMLGIAKLLKVPPREVSFKHSLVLINTLAESFESITTNSEFDELLRRAFHSINRLKLPKRKREPEPRKVWPRGQVNFMTKSRAEERLALKLPRRSRWLHVQ
jgi:Transposase DDE domain